MSNASALGAATEPQILPLRSLTLIGVRLTPDGNFALLRTSDGTITKVTTGARINGETVAAIDQTGLVFDGGARTGIGQSL